MSNCVATGQRFSKSNAESFLGLSVAQPWLENERGKRRGKGEGGEEREDRDAQRKRGEERTLDF